MPNVNPDTGIRYGLISAQALHPDIIFEIQQYGVDIHWRDQMDEIRAQVNREVEAGHVAEEDIDDELDLCIERQGDRWYDDEPVHEFELQGVRGQTTWLGGALLVWVFESPYQGNYRMCSPCVPNAGDLDNSDPDGVTCYDVPSAWRIS